MMKKPALVSALVLAFGFLMGLLVAHYLSSNGTGEQNITATDSHQTIDTKTASAVAQTKTLADEALLTSREASTSVETVVGSTIEADEPTREPNKVSSNIIALRSQLALESAARQELQNDLAAVMTTLNDLEQRFDELNQTRPRNRRLSENQAIDEATLIAAGFQPHEASYLTERINQQELDRLYLRDQAIREGWIDTPRYREELEALGVNRTALREELGTAGYDRYLFATGRPNRVAVTSIIDNSSAHAIGLQAGDMIIRYDNNPIFSPTDLSSATTSSDVDTYVAMQVDRDGELLEVYLPAGPIGVRIEANSVKP